MSADASDRLDVTPQAVPARESVGFRNRALRIPETPELGLTPQQVLGLTLQLIEVGTRGQRSNGHTDLLPKLA